MRTTIHLSDGLLKEVLQETRAKTITQAIRDALEAFLQHRKRLRLIASFRRFPEWDPDVQAMRKRRDLD